MTFDHSFKGRLRTAALAVLMPALGMPLTSQAAIDVGETTVSVRTETKTETITGSMPGSNVYLTTTTAIFDRHAGVVDQQTGLQWIKANTLEEGQAQGYRAATAEEFKSLVTGSGWAATGEANVYTLTNGPSYTNGYSYSDGGGQTNVVTNLAPITFDSDKMISLGNYPISWSDGAVSMGLLAGNDADPIVGALFSLGNGNYGLSACSSGKKQQCNYRSTYTRDAVVASLADLNAGLYDNASHSSGSAWSALTNKVTQGENGASLKYFMVASAVPEPATWGLMGVGLMAVAAAARRRSKA